MKKRLLSLCLAVSISSLCIACGSKTEPETPDVPNIEESVENNEVPSSTSVSDEAPTDITGDIDTEIDEGTDDSSGSKASDFDCSVFTEASYSDVSEFAKQIKDLALAENWDKLGDMINYPVEDSSGKVCNTKEDFINYATNTGFDKSLYDSLNKWTIDAIWFNSEGACIDDGNIWFNDVSFNDIDLKIISFWGLRSK